ncbi:MAG: penicillin-binding protein 2 [candidate division Zixibacteria bacterium]|nr:penicillin-binding protein 2 [candidate division Zixibacteria bacterium]
MKGSRISDYNRGKVAYYFFGVIAFALLFRLIYLQIIDFAYYRKVSEENRIRLVSVPAPRGVIRDRNQKKMVTNRTSYTLFLLPYEISNLDELVKKTSAILKLDESFLKEKVKTGLVNRYTPIRLIRDVDFKTICVLEEQNDELPGVIYQVEKVRSYPKTFWAGHLFGYVGEVSQKEMDSMEEKRLRLGSSIGKEGLEKEYDEVLRGVDGMSFLEVSASGKVLGPLKDKNPLPFLAGSDLDLTIDYDLQIEAESALSNYNSCALVALDPQNGEVLALVSKPGFDPNQFSSFLDEKSWQALTGDPSKPLLNRAVQGVYPPASTYKLLTAGAALEAKIADRNTTFSYCNGRFPFGTRVFKCWRPEGHGRLNLIQAIVQSCDVYFYQLALKLGLDRWSYYALESRLDKKFKIDLPDEASGMIPTRSYYQKKFGNGEWIKNLVINLGIGQGEVLTTPLGMAVFYSALVNGGIVYQPHILNKIKSPEGKVFINKKMVLFHLPFSEATLEVLKEALVEAVNSPSGTGGLARIPDITVGGKTGTAQNPHGKEHAWFVGFAPAEYPKIVVAVLIEQAGHGGTFAAPVAKKIITKYLKGKIEEPAEEGNRNFQTD